MKSALGILLLAGITLGILGALRGIDPSPISGTRELYFDSLQRLKPRVPQDLPVRIVDIDEGSLRKLGQWPWPRHQMAELTTKLRDLGAEVVVFDILFAEPDRLSASRVLEDPEIRQAADHAPSLASLARFDNDVTFAEAIATMPTVLGVADAGLEGAPPSRSTAGFVQIGENPADSLEQLHSATPIVPVLREVAAGVGSINVNPNAPDSIVREVPLVWRSSSGPIPSLALEGLRIAMDEQTVLLQGVPGTPGVTSIRLGQFDVPTTSSGQIRIYYRSDTTIDYISAAHVLEASFARNIAPLVEGHIVFVGTSAAGLFDIRTTALGERVPGVSIHAQIVEQVLSNTFLRRSDVVAGLEILSLLTLGTIVALTMAFIGPILAVSAGALSAVILSVAGWLAFARHGILFDLTFPLFGGFMLFGILAAFQYTVSDRERRLIRRSFSKYVSSDILKEIERAGHKLQLGGEARDVTVMFSDIRNFTPLSETMTPQELVSLLNTLFNELTDDIIAESGTIDKYIGDSIMAFWNAPLELDGHRRAACLAALRMRRTLKEFNAPRAEKGLVEIGLSIGLASGQASVGNIGSDARYNYSAIGETVNVAARIEANSRHVAYDVLVAEDVAQAANDIASLFAGFLTLKGVTARTKTYIVVGGEQVGATAEFHELRAAHELLVDQLAKGEDARQRLERCKELSRRIDPALAFFYDRIPNRSADFMP